ncbi:MAG: STAS/SEC14 domain-containing protein [Woeseiaceae bacterium]
MLVSGTSTIEDMLSAKERILHISEKHGTNRLLVDTRDMLSAAQSIDLFEFGLNWPHTIRAAILFGDHTAQDMRFLETVAVNRGKEIRLFADEASALDWLGA